MPLNPDAVGSQSDPAEVSWTSKDTLLYAVSLGCGTSELQYTTENTKDVAQQVLPTFPVVIPGGAGAMRNIGTFNPAMLVHGSQSVTLHQPLPVEGKATVVGKVTAMYDKVKAGIVAMETTATAEDGSLLYTTGSSMFIRGEGGFGGDRGPSGPQNVPPEREPDHSVTYVTSPDQALLYRLNGDRNPLHSDPSFAAMGGFDRPILHGLCSYGFTGRALLHVLCGGESANFKHIEGRFASPVIPGEALTINAWVIGDGEAVFATSVGDRTVIDQGLLRFSS
ncbi:MAG: MaoC/PaaZ C-terminal domain-containing protein [Ilumatobacteraceae bacterium]